MYTVHEYTACNSNVVRYMLMAPMFLLSSLHVLAASKVNFPKWQILMFCYFLGESYAQFWEIQSLILDSLA